MDKATAGEVEKDIIEAMSTDRVSVLEREMHAMKFAVQLHNDKMNELIAEVNRLSRLIKT